MRSLLLVFGMNVEELIQLAIYLSLFIGLLFLTYRSLKPAYLDRCGWRWIRPALMHHFALLGSAAFSAVMWWMYFFVGSARPDASDQETAMILLASAFAAAFFVTWWLYYANTVSWKGNIIRAGRFGTYRYHDLRTIIDIVEVDWRSQWRLEFADGSIIYVSDTSHGFDELGDHLDRIVA